jgi:hypothetical protein
MIRRTESRVTVGTTAVVGPLGALLSDRQYQFFGFLVSVSDVSMPVSVLFHLFYAVAMGVVDFRHHHYQYSQFHAAHILHR